LRGRESHSEIVLGENSEPIGRRIKVTDVGSERELDFLLDPEDGSRTFHQHADKLLLDYTASELVTISRGDIKYRQAELLPKAPSQLDLYSVE
jgi:hypothetical protein